MAGNKKLNNALWYVPNATKTHDSPHQGRDEKPQQDGTQSPHRTFPKLMQFSTDNSTKDSQVEHVTATTSPALNLVTSHFLD